MICKISIPCQQKKYDSYYTYTPKNRQICMILSYIYTSCTLLFDHPYLMRAINITILFLIFSYSQVQGQIKFGNLRLRVIQSDYHYWNEISLANSDTTIVRQVSPYFRRLIIDSIPQGSYLASMVSDFGNKVSKKVIIRNQSKLTFKLKCFYTKDKLSKSFFDQLKPNDTLIIMSYQKGCFSFLERGCIIFKQDSNWVSRRYIGNKFEYFSLNKEEIDSLKSIENLGRNNIKNKVFSTTSTRYSFVLGNKIIETRISGATYLHHIFKNHNKLIEGRY